MALAFPVSTIFSAVDQFTPTVNKMQGATASFLKTSNAGFSKFERNVNKITPSLGGLGDQIKQLAFAGGAFAIGALAVKSLVDYDQAIQDLSAITGAVGPDLDLFKDKIKDVATQTKSSSIEVAKGFEIVGSKQPELLKNAAALAEVTKQSIILAKASGDDLATSAENLTGIMNQFNLSQEEAARTANVLAAGQIEGSAGISLVAESMKNFGAVASGANITLEQSVALVEVMAKKSIVGAEAGTKLRGATLKLQKANLGYASGQFSINDALDEAKKKADAFGTAAEKDAFILKTFGAENVTTGQILLSNIGAFEELTGAVQANGQAQTAADIKTRSFSNALKEIQNKFITVITTNKQATGVLGAFADVLFFVGDHLGTIIGLGAAYLGFILAANLAVKAVALSQFLYGVALGVTTVLQGGSAMALRGNTIALGAYKVAMGISTAATWAFGAAAAAAGLPIWAIALAVIALIALVTSAIIYFEDWGAAFLILTGPVGILISMFMGIKKHWASITDAFNNDGLVAGFKRLGLVILDSLLMPIQQLLELINKIPGVNVSAGVDFISDIRANLLDDPNAEGVSPAINNAATTEENSVLREEKKETNMLEIMLSNTGGADIDINKIGNFNGVNLMPTL